MGKFAGLVKFTGKTGDIVGAKGTKGDYIAKAYQPTVKNPQTVGQLTTRVKFLTATGLAKMLLNANGFANIAKSRRVSAFNVMSSLFFKNSELITFLNPPTDMSAQAKIQWGSLVIADGDMELNNFENPNLQEEAEVKLTWAAASDQQNTDIMHIVIVQPDSNGVVHTAVNASAGSATVRVPDVWSGMQAQIYAFRQGVDSETTRATYMSLFNNNNVAASASRRTIESASRFSPSTYVGNGPIA